MSKQFHESWICALSDEANSVLKLLNQCNWIHWWFIKKSPPLRWRSSQREIYRFFTIFHVFIVCSWGNVKMLILGQETNLFFFSKSTSCSQGRFWRIMLYIWCFTYKLLCRDLFRFFIFFLSEDAISEPFKRKSEHVVNVHSAILTSFLLKMDNLTSFSLSISEPYSSKSKLKLEIFEKKYETSLWKIYKIN